MILIMIQEIATPLEEEIIMIVIEKDTMKEKETLDITSYCRLQA